LRIAIGVPDELDGPRWNGFRTAFNDLRGALSGHSLTVYSPSGGDVRLEGTGSEAPMPMGQYFNTMALSRDFACKAAGCERIIAFSFMGLFLDRSHIYYTSNVPYRKVAELAEGEYPDEPRFRELLDYYRFVAGKEGENYEKAERIIVMSEKLRELIHSLYGIERKRIFYVPRPIPRLATGPRTPAGGAMKIIFMPAELRVMKGIRYAIETMKLLRERVPEAVLVICGRINGYEKEYISGLVREARGKANIVLAGFPPRERYLSLMAGSDCAFMPFCYDECPVSLAECVGSGVPLVTNEYAGYARDVIGRFGYRARHNDIEDYARGLERMLNDRGYREGKAVGAQEVAREFTTGRYREAIADAVES
jgi:glycosyltransferase involved in cell wall biosynthesis